MDLDFWVTAFLAEAIVSEEENQDKIRELEDKIRELEDEEDEFCLRDEEDDH